MYIWKHDKHWDFAFTVQVYACTCGTYIHVHRVVATVGGAGRGRPALTISARHNNKKNDFRPAQYFFIFLFFLVPGTMFHNRGSIIAQYTCYIHWKWPCQALNPRRGIAPGPPPPPPPGHWRCASLASLTPLAIIIHNYFPMYKNVPSQNIH